MLGSNHGIWSTIAKSNLDNSHLNTGKFNLDISQLTTSKLGSAQLKESNCPTIKQITPPNTNSNLKLDHPGHNPAGFLSSRATSSLVAGYSELVTSRIQNGWSCDLLTIVFDQLASQPQSIRSRMRDEIQKIYSIVLTRVNRNPKKASADDLPILIGALDLPVHKLSRTKTPLVRCNDGLHFHGLLLIPPNSRLKVTPKHHFESNADLYLKAGSSVQRIHVEPVIATPDRVVDYVFKTIRKGRVTYDEGALILPRARTEL